MELVEVADDVGAELGRGVGVDGQQLQRQLSELEDEIQASRRIYNSNVQQYNTRIQQWPWSIIANQGGFTAKHLPPRDPAVLAAVAAVVERVRDERSGVTQDTRTVMLNREPAALNVTGKDGNFTVKVGDRSIAVQTGWAPGEPLMHGKVDGQDVAVQVDAVGSGWRLVSAQGTRIPSNPVSP